MIRVDNNHVILKGDDVLVLSELTALVYGLNESLCETRTKDRAKEIIMKSVELAFLSEEELDKQAKQAEKKAKDHLDEFMKKLFEGRL